MTFISADSTRKACDFREGQSVLDVAFENSIEIEGACGGQCNCSTCHVILKEEDYKKFEEPEEKEMDVLDLAPGVTDLSRLGCQMRLTKEHDGFEAQLPKETRNQLLD